MLRFSLLLTALLALLATACGVDQAPRADRTHHPRALLLAHLTPAQAAAVLAHPEQARAFVEGRVVGEGMRAVSAARVESGVRVDFQFPLASAAYTLHHPALDAPVLLAQAPRLPTPPHVLGVLPDAPVLPSNVLRLYVAFDEAMSSKFLMSEVVEVVDLADQTVVDASLLDVEQPLFDGTQTRLTVVFNPGRTKRGVGSNAQGGPPLRPGRKYGLRIKAGMRDAQGDALQTDFVHVFHTEAPERTAVDVSAWTLSRPRATTRDALRVDFGRWMDPRQAESRVALLNPFGRRFPLEAKSGGRTLTLTPREAWAPGCYTLLVSHELEDVSGNRPARAFDAKGKGTRRAVTRAVSIGSTAECPPRRQPAL